MILYAPLPIENGRGWGGGGHKKERKKENNIPAVSEISFENVDERRADGRTESDQFSSSGAKISKKIILPSYSLYI